MTDLPSVPAQRLRRPSWRDPRLAIGVVLVMLSVVLGARVVAAADDSTPLWAAAHPLTPGDSLDADDLVAVQVRADDAASRYLPATEALRKGLVVLRSVGEGELVARSAVGSDQAVAVRPVAIPVESALPAGLRKAALVDVWVADPDPERAGAFLRPRQLVQAAEVAEVSEGSGPLASAQSRSVQVLVHETVLPEVLAALANDAAVSLVLLPGPLGHDGGPVKGGTVPDSLAADSAPASSLLPGTLAPDSPGRDAPSGRDAAESAPEQASGAGPEPSR